MIQSGLFQDELLDARITEKGEELSGTDRIRLLMTRSLLHEPNILVFETPRKRAHEQCFNEILEAYLEDHECTLLLGAFRTDQLEGTDRTILLENGKIANDGPTGRILSVIKAGAIHNSLARD